MANYTIPVLYVLFPQYVAVFVPIIGQVKLNAMNFETAEEEASVKIPELVKNYIAEHGSFPDVTEADLPIVQQIKVCLP